MTTSEWRDLPTMPDVAAAQAAGEDIEVRGHVSHPWRKWRGEMWDKTWLFRARSVSKVKKVKILGWVNFISGATRTTGSIPYEFDDSGWVRDPEMDREIEVPE